MSLKSCLLIILMVVLCPFQTQAEPTISSKTQYYSIEGHDARTLRNQMTTKGPQGLRGKKRFWAHTRWYVNWSFRYGHDRSGCKIKSVDVHAKVIFEMPQWNSEDSADAALQKSWKKFYKNLYAHEKQHAQHGIEAAYAIEDRVKKMHDGRGCDDLQERAHKVADQIAKEYAHKDIDFDKSTRHGILSGVVLK